MGLYEFNQRRFDNSVRYFFLAEETFHIIHDEVERAEFNYKAGAANYHHEDYILAARYAIKALIGYEKNGEKQKKVADCKVLLGQAYTDLKEFEKVTHYFNEALIDYIETNNHNFLYILYQNLDYLYSRRGISNKAIENYYHSLKLNDNLDFQLPTYYLLSRELFNIGETEEAVRALDKGFDITNKINNQEYFHHLKILQSEYLEASKLEETITSMSYEFKIKRGYEPLFII